MAGSFRSRIAIMALAACTALASTSVYVVDHVAWGMSRAAKAFRDLSCWLVARLPRLRPDWMRPDIAVRVRQDGTLQMRKVIKQRPLVSPRWRMCPSI